MASDCFGLFRVCFATWHDTLIFDQPLGPRKSRGAKDVEELHCTDACSQFVSLFFLITRHTSTRTHLSSSAPMVR